MVLRTFLYATKYRGVHEKGLHNVHFLYLLSFYSSTQNQLSNLSIPLHKISWANTFQETSCSKETLMVGGGVINKSTSIYFVPWCLVYQAAQVLKTGSSYPKQNILKTTNSFKQTKIPVSKNNPKGQEKDLLGMLRLAFLSCVVEKKLELLCTQQTIVYRINIISIPKPLIRRDYQSLLPRRFS